MIAHDIKHIVFDLDDTLLATTSWQLGTRISHIKPFEGIVDLLHNLTIPYSILTVGDIFTQNEKVANAKIPAVHFVCADNGVEKLDCMSSIIRLYSLDSRRVLVIGDKISQEIKYGNHLGCTTVRAMFGGKHDINHPQTQNETPDFTVDSVSSLVLLLSSWNILKTQV